MCGRNQCSGSFTGIVSAQHQADEDSAAISAVSVVYKQVDEREREQ